MLDKNKEGHIPEMFFDQFNCEMFDNVRPRHWIDPEIDGKDKYDILVIGAGAGGLTAAAGSAGMGAKSCMIERAFIGGDCLVSGCVPSKAFISACNAAHTVRNCEQYGVKI